MWHAYAVSTRALVDSPPPFSSVIETTGNVASLAAGAVIFLPALGFLVFTEGGTASDWFTWGIPVLVWLASYAVSTRITRSSIQAAAGFTLVLMTFVDPGSDRWISITTICFAVIVGAVFNLPTRGAAVVVMAATLLDLTMAVMLDATRVIFGVVELVPWAGAAIQLFAGGGLLLAWQSWMRNVGVADAELDSIKEAIESDQQESAIRDGTEAVARRIHETILNTLAAISMGVVSSREEEARQACRRDLNQMSRDLQRLDACSLQDIVDAAVTTIQPLHLVCDVIVVRDRVVSARIANALHDALVEALRNVERHSGDTKALVEVRWNGDVHVVVSDRGSGPSPSATERFGLRNSIRANMASIGGKATMTRNADGGTTVTLEAPIDASSPVLVPTFPILGAADGTLIGRLGAAGTNVFMLLILIPVLNAMPSPVPLAVTTLAYIAVILALAFAWTTRLRSLLNWAGIALLAGPFIAVASNPLDCAASPALQGLFAGASGGALLLLLVANRPLYRRILISALTTGASFLALAQMPAQCRSEPALTIGVNVIYLAAIVSVLTWIDLRFEVRRQQAQEAWQHHIEEQSARERQAAFSRGWSLIGPGARDLLEGIADGSVKIQEPETRTQAAAEAATIRSGLGLVLEPGDTFGALTRRLVRVARHVGATVDAEALTPAQRSDHLPEAVLILIEDLVRQCEGTTVTLRAFADEDSDEITIVLPIVATLTESVKFIDDVAVQAEVSGNQTIVMIRRSGSHRHFFD